MNNLDQFNTLAFGSRSLQAATTHINKQIQNNKYNVNNENTAKTNHTQPTS